VVVPASLAPAAVVVLVMTVTASTLPMLVVVLAGRAVRRVRLPECRISRGPVLKNLPRQSAALAEW
jgi:hypothetical protein